MRAKLLALACGFLVLGFSHLARAAEVVWIDVRTAEEFAEGHVTQAINIPHEQIVEGIAQLSLDKDQPIYLYCGSGRRAGIAMADLQELGYQQVENLGGLEDALQRQEEEDPAAAED